MFYESCVSSAHSHFLAYSSFVSLYNIIGIVPTAEFKTLINDSNGTARILLSHFLAFHVLLRPLATHEYGLHRDASPLYDTLESWVYRIHADLDFSLRKYNEWPVSFVRQTSPWSNLNQQLDATCGPTATSSSAMLNR